MGGYGSGRSLGYYAKTTVEECKALDIRELHRTGADGLFRVCTWYRNEEKTGSISWRIVEGSLNLAYTVTDRNGDEREHNYRVPITWTPCNYGGQRPWLLCQGIVDGVHCGRRVAKLYMPPGGELFLCRHCWNLSYESQREDEAHRLLDKAQKIRQRLGGSPNLFHDFPQRPKGMHRETYERLRREALYLEQAADIAMARRLGLLL